MHYKNGREAKAGDRIVGADCSGNPIGGVLFSVTPASTTCNGYVVPQIAIEKNQRLVTLGDCLHIDDFTKKAESPPDAVAQT